MRIVSNTGPIIGLAKIGMLDLLKALAGEVLIPPFVQKELFGRTGADPFLIGLGWFLVYPDFPFSDLWFLGFLTLCSLCALCEIKTFRSWRLCGFA